MSGDEVVDFVVDSLRETLVGEAVKFAAGAVEAGKADGETPATFGDCGHVFLLPVRPATNASFRSVEKVRIALLILGFRKFKGFQFLGLREFV